MSGSKYVHGWSGPKPAKRPTLLDLYPDKIGQLLCLGLTDWQWGHGPAFMLALDEALPADDAQH